jgi:DNA-binding transcriptional MocR family regulator
VFDMGSGVVEQAALATLLATRGLDRHLRRMRKHYAARLDALLAALAREMPPETTWSEPRSGHIVWLTLPAGIDADRLQQIARERGVAYGRGELFYFDERGAESLALSFASLDAGAIAEGVTRLAAAIREVAVKQRRASGRRVADTPAGRAAARTPRGRRTVDAAS